VIRLAPLFSFNIATFFWRDAIIAVIESLPIMETINLEMATGKGGAQVYSEKDSIEWEVPDFQCLEIGICENSSALSKAQFRFSRIDRLTFLGLVAKR
jgi:hypothetical protein